MNSRIVITIPYPGLARNWRDGIAARLPEAEVFIDEGQPAQADCAVGWKPSADFFGRITGLRVFMSATAGVDTLLGHPGIPADLPIMRIEDGGRGLPMAEYCCAELFRHAQRRDLYEAQQREGVWKPRGYTPRAQMTVGVYGFGVLGRAIAAMIRPFGYTIIGAASSSRTEDGIEVLGPERADEFFGRSNVLILVAPLTDATRGAINRDTLAKMPEGSWLINVGRGPLVVEADLVAAIDAGRLRGASLDVFDIEPLPAGHRFWSHPGIRLTPHVSAATDPGVAVEQAANKIADWLAGRPTSGMVVRERGY